MAPDRPLSRRTCARRRGSSRRPHHVLLRRGRWRHLEDRKRRRNLVARFRSPAHRLHRRLAVAPSNPNIIYAGTGEADMRSRHRASAMASTSPPTPARPGPIIGLARLAPDRPDRHRPARIPISSTSPRLGHAYGPNEERGVYRSKDGGRSWQKVLDRGPNIGAGDLAMDPANPRILYAGVWARAPAAVEQVSSFERSRQRPL